MFAAILTADVTSGASENLATFVVKGLAVGGGFLVGYFLGTVIAWALDRWLLAHKAPPQLKKLVALVAGVALAILVALIVFGEGGSGIFGSRGDTGDKNKSTTEGKKDPAPQPQVKQPEQPPKIDTPVTPAKPADAVIRVTILGGTDVPNNDERYYLIDDDPTRKNLSELEAAVIARKEMLKGTVALAIHYRPANKPTQNPEAESITSLRRFAERAKLDVTFPAQK